VGEGNSSLSHPLSHAHASGLCAASCLGRLDSNSPWPALPPTPVHTCRCFRLTPAPSAPAPPAAGGREGAAALCAMRYGWAGAAGEDTRFAGAVQGAGAGVSIQWQVAGEVEVQCRGWICVWVRGTAASPTRSPLRLPQVVRCLLPSLTSTETHPGLPCLPHLSIPAGLATLHQPHQPHQHQQQEGGREQPLRGTCTGG
jgi:hypothetical protein